jgi:hypothetical protein
LNGGWRLLGGEMDNFAGFEGGDGDAIPQHQAIGRDRRDARTGSENPREVQWIGRADGYQRAWRRLFAQGTQQTYSFGQGKLLAADTGDEIAAANFAAGFEPAKRSAELIPRRVRWLAFQQPSKNDAIAEEQHTSPGLDSGFTSFFLPLLWPADGAGRPVRAAGKAPSLPPAPWQRNPLPSKDQRPANSTLLTLLCRGLRSVCEKGIRFSCGKSKARSPSKLSDVTQP